jgi:hypothetical protein
LKLKAEPRHKNALARAGNASGSRLRLWWVGRGAKRYRDERFEGGLTVFRRGFSGIADCRRGGELPSTRVESLNE